MIVWRKWMECLRGGTRTLAHLHWQVASRELWRRSAQDRLSLIASSLTFTTIIALIPFLSVALAVFSAHPLFAQLQPLLQKWLVDTLVPDPIARQVMHYTGQFTAKAHRLGAAGFAALLVSAFALVMTIDRTFNQIWRTAAHSGVHRQAIRWGIYAALMGAGPLLLAASLSLTTYAVVHSRVYVGGQGVRLAYATLEFMLSGAGLYALYRYVPQTPVRRRHALVGALLTASILEGAKKLLSAYLLAMPAYNKIYGAFSALPILLIWIYLAWLVVLLGAEATACMRLLHDAPPHRTHRG